MIDALDIVSLLLGGALSYLVVASLTQRSPNIGAAVRIALMIGATLVLGYGLSEVFHALRALRG